jgi:hypothetical protein
MTDSEPEPVLALLSTLDDVHSDDGPGPRPGSPADTEAKGFTKPLSVQTAYACGFTALASAGDHLEAVDLIVRLGQPSVAHWTSLRGLLEAASIASWQLDTTIDAPERVSTGRTTQALERAFTDLGLAYTDSVRFWRSDSLSS